MRQLYPARRPCLAQKTFLLNVPFFKHNHILLSAFFSLWQNSRESFFALCVLIEF
jgi:hypothetical protein